MDSRSSFSTSPEDVKPDDGEKRQNARACDYCHRMKMKCIGKEEPPCNRCRASGRACTFDGPRKTKASKVEDRLKAVEEQMADVQSSLAELVALRRESTSSARDVELEPDDRRRSSTTSHPTPSAPQRSRSSGSAPVFVNPFAKDPKQPTLPYLAPLSPTSRRSSHESTFHTPHSHTHWDERARGTPLEAEQSEEEDSHGIYNNMLSLAEAARLKADGLEEAYETPRKRAAEPVEKDTKRPRNLRDLPLQRGSLQFQNPVELGFCSATKGEQLYDLFMDTAAIYVPVLDPAVDTWASLCATAPFTVTVVLFVGAKIEDAGGEPSELQVKCKAHAENIGMHTLFTPVPRIDVLQAMIILSSWGDTSWRPGGHALRIAMDMGLYRCLPHLAASGMGSGKTAAELADERPHVVGARCWLAVYKSECEMAFNLGRPALFAAEDTLRHSRGLLEHPLALRTDSRLVAACELLSLRLPVHQLYSVWPATTHIPNLDERIDAANASYATWFTHWEAYYRRLSVPRSSFLHESLRSQHAHAVLHTNSRILHSVRSRRHVGALPPARRAMLVQALQSAQALVSLALRGGSYAAHFAMANYYTHVGIAFAARMLIRLASLIPEHGDLHQTGRDLEAVTALLAQVPGYQFAQHIRDVVVRARSRRELPPRSGDVTPQNDEAAHRRASPVSALRTPEPHDFIYAEKLLGRGDLDLDIFHLDSWFPYPPLESDGSFGSPLEWP